MYKKRLKQKGKAVKRKKKRNPTKKYAGQGR